MKLPPGATGGAAVCVGPVELGAGVVRVAAGAGCGGVGTAAVGFGAGCVSVTGAGALSAAGVTLDAAGAEDVGAEAAEDELGDGLKLSKPELPALAGSASLVSAGSAVLDVVVDLRPRL
jgi:hypothetical protein